MDQVCPWCKTTKYRNPNMELMVNVCGHNICETCVELLFVELRLKGWAHTASESLSFFREVVNVPKYDENDNDSNYPRIISHNEAHSERCKVTGVAWCPVQGGAGRDSGAEDGVVSDQWPIRGRSESVSANQSAVFWWGPGGWTWRGAPSHRRASGRQTQGGWPLISYYMLRLRPC